MSRPIAWSVAGSDSGGGAGIQADLRAMQALGVHGCSVITASTAQNSVGVTEVHTMPLEHIVAQYNTLASDLSPQAIKLGMLVNADIIRAVAKQLIAINAPIILDPVMVSTSGSPLLDPAAIESMRAELFPLAEVITPNRQEAEYLCQHKIETTEAVVEAAHQLIAQGARSVLLKGGHDDGHWAADFWTDGKTEYWLTASRIQNDHTHGSGCTLSSAIASARAQGHDLRNAMVLAKMAVTQGIRQGMQLGQGPGPVWVTHYPNAEQDLPFVTTKPITEETVTFPSCTDLEPLGLYPIVERAQQLEMLLPSGCTTYQIRIKDLSGEALKQEITQAIQIASSENIRLFINDYWQLAIELGAYGVHLGQEDIHSTDLEAIRSAGLRLGLSTHDFFEVATAHALKPSYIAIGPIFPTTSKVMPFAPQGISMLKYWQSLLNYPLVAIAGINTDNIQAVAETGVSGIAMISAILQAQDPVKAAQALRLRHNMGASISA